MVQQESKLTEHEHKRLRKVYKQRLTFLCAWMVQDILYTAGEFCAILGRNNSVTKGNKIRNTPSFLGRLMLICGFINPILLGCSCLHWLN